MFKIYTDGSCLKPQGPGGYAFVIIEDDGTEYYFCEGENNTTNNRMELMAVIKGLQCLSRSMPVKIVTDSQYVKNAFTEGWLENWKKNSWKTRTKQDVKNKDLWLELSATVDEHKVIWQWVKGHSGDKYNDICDEIARQAIKSKKGIDERTENGE
jgi:ribonuclease HI